jgi:hypothetical protein
MLSTLERIEMKVQSAYVELDRQYDLAEEFEKNAKLRRAAGRIEEPDYARELSISPTREKAHA